MSNQTPPAAPTACLINGHTWSNPVEDDCTPGDYTPDNGTPCDCGERLWNTPRDPVTPPPQPVTGEPTPERLRELAKAYRELDPMCDADVMVCIEAGARALEQVARLEGLERELRQEWWLGHGHAGLYGDDGEMQCGYCLADFKRDPIDLLREKTQAARFQRGVAVMQEYSALQKAERTLAGVREIVRRVQIHSISLRYITAINEIAALLSPKDA